MGKRMSWAVAAAVLCLSGCAGPAPSPGGGTVKSGAPVQCHHNPSGRCDLDVPPFPDIEAHKGGRPNYPDIVFIIKGNVPERFVGAGIVFEAGAPFACNPPAGDRQVLCRNTGTGPGGPFKYSILLNTGTIDPFVLNK